jgi:hypothetical protein
VGHDGLHGVLGVRGGCDVAVVSLLPVLQNCSPRGPLSAGGLLVASPGISPSDIFVLLFEFSSLKKYM